MTNQTCATCQILAQCPVAKNILSVHLPNQCDYFVPQGGTVLDLDWMVKRLEETKT